MSPDAGRDRGARAEAAERWLHCSYRAGATIDLLAAAGMAVPRLYGPTLRFRPRFRRSRPEFAYAIRTGAPLMLGCATLLLWADRQPLERRGVLAITVVPVLAGLVANDAHAVRAGWLSPRGVLPVRQLQLALAMLFAISYAKAARAAADPGR